MRFHMITGLMLGTLMVAVPGVLAADPVTADHIVREAQRVRAEALEVRQLLRAKSPDPTIVNQRVDTLQTHTKALTQSLEAFETSSAALSATQAQALERARAAGAVLAVMLSNKTSMLSDADSAGKQRSLIRAKAEGIAKRATIVETQMARVRG